MNKRPLKSEYAKLCRTCLSTNTCMKSIYSNEEILDFKTTLKDILMTCTSIQINKDDGLPENVCHNCAEELNRAFIFKKLCEKSDFILRDWMRSDASNDVKSIKTDANDDNYSVNTTCIDNIRESSKIKLVTNKIKQNVEDDNMSCTNLEVVSYKCSLCNQTFNSRKAFEDHQQNHEKHMSKKRNDSKYIHKIRKKRAALPKTCNICNKTFRFHNDLVKHTLTHTGEKPFLCNMCGKAFAQMSYLRIHSNIHTGEKPYKCDTCDKCFTAPGTLKRHIRTHTGERPHKCNICGKDFRQSGYLATHIRMHTGEKRIECKICHKRFNQSGRLTIHMRIHSGEKPYKCLECGKCFAVKGSLERHRRIHTGERPYKCNKCDQAFAQSSTLATHMKIHVKKK